MPARPARAPRARPRGGRAPQNTSGERRPPLLSRAPPPTLAGHRGCARPPPPCPRLPAARRPRGRAARVLRREPQPHPEKPARQLGRHDAPEVPGPRAGRRLCRLRDPVRRRVLGRRRARGRRGARGVGGRVRGAVRRELEPDLRRDAAALGLHAAPRCAGRRAQETRVGPRLGRRFRPFGPEAPATPPRPPPRTLSRSMPSPPLRTPPAALRACARILSWQAPPASCRAATSTAPRRRCFRRPSAQPRT
jgi:hypothetical protein